MADPPDTATTAAAEDDVGEKRHPPPPPAAAAGDEEEYVSDLDDAPLPAMRRREASDDEGSEAAAAAAPPRARIGSDAESDGEGGAEVYDEEEEEEEEFYDDEEGEGFEEEYEEAAAAAGVGEDRKEVADERSRGEEVVVEDHGRKEGEGEGEVEGEEKKENEPYAVPTAGAFYMHDDRFQENGRGRRRRMFGGRKLWDPKEEHAWVHDRFEEMNLQDAHYEEKRMSRGRFRGRGSGNKTRGAARGFSRGGKYHTYHGDGNNQNRAPKVVRGRGPRRYESLTKNNREIVATQHKQPARSREQTSNVGTVREPRQISHAQPEAAAPKKNVFASSLNYASPPFYPSGTSNQDFSVAQRRDIQTGNSSKVLSSSMKMDDNLRLQSGSITRGKTVMNSGGHDRLYVDDSLRPTSARTVTMSPLHSSGFNNSGQASNVRVQVGSSNSGASPNSQSTSSLHQISRASTQQQTQNPGVHQKPLQVPTQSAVRMATQQFGQRSGSQSSPPPQHLSVRSTEVGEHGSHPSSNKSKTPSVGTGKTSNQEAGRGSFVYGGAQVIGAAGAVGLAQGEQSFPGTPALLPVMQFGGQHPGGLGVPTVGMALPGYVAQQHGGGNSEMTWLPVLAGAAGAFGASYPPYIALDPSFYSRPSGQSSSSASSREHSGSKVAKSPPRNETVNEELDQRQNKPRRYSEMNFGQ